MRTRSGLMALGMLTAAFVGGFAAELTVGRIARAEEAAQPQVVTAQAVRIVDAQGKERALLGLADDQVALVLKDPEGHSRVALGSAAGEDPAWRLAIMDAKAQDRFMCGAWEGGNTSGMRIRDWNGTLRVGLGAAEYGCGLAFHNEDAREVLGAGAGPRGGGDFYLKRPSDGSDLWRASQHIAPAE